MKRAALTFIGKDRPGIIAAVTRVLFESGCNVEDTTMTILEGEFAMILIALLPSERARRKLKIEYDRLKKRWGLHHFWKELPVQKGKDLKHPRGTKTYILSIIGKDRTGIVYGASRILAQFGLNITDLNCKISGSPARPLFAMILEVDAPNRFNIKRLDPSLKRLRKNLGVDVQIRPLEHLSL